MKKPNNIREVKSMVSLLVPSFNIDKMIKDHNDLKQKKKSTLKNTNSDLNNILKNYNSTTTSQNNNKLR